MTTAVLRYDDLGAEVRVPSRPQRVVSLVPSLTEAVAATDRDLLVGATDWCTHPGDLDVRRVRGTKNPDRAAILDLAPDLVLANQEENRELDVRRLRDAGVAVWVTRTESVPEALASMRRLFTDVLDTGVPRWLEQATELWSVPSAPRARVLVPIWRNPWMAVGRDTFCGDLLGRAGLVNVLADSPDRYPRFDPSVVLDPDLVLLPDEPYAFTDGDGPESFTAPSRLVSGRLLTWYGPSLVPAYDALRDLGPT